MMSRAYALLVVCASGAMSCGRTELDLGGGAAGGGADARDADGAFDVRVADAARDALATEAPEDATCRWSFAPRTTYGAGSSPGGIAAGDFNGDGYPDIITTNSPDNTVSLLFNRGDGTFAPHVTSGVGLMPFGLAVGDWNSDGDLDFAVIDDYQAMDTSPSVDVFFNRGDGTFARAGRVAKNGGAGGILSGDFNGDGHLDLALMDPVETVSVLLNKGDGTFLPPVTSGGVVGLWFFTAADYNQDGALDLVAASAFSTAVLFNHGDGTFAPPVTYDSAACYEVGAVAGGDFNGDGYPDLAYDCFQEQTVVVRINRGDGSLGPEVSYPTGSWPLGIGVGDFDGDGRNDLAIVNSFAYAESVSLLLNAGGGGGGFQPQITYAVDAWASYVVTSDFNADGHPDLAVTTSDAVDVLLSECR